MKKALLEASLALSLLTIFCFGAFSIKEPSIEVPDYQELSTGEENTQKEQQYLDERTGQNEHPLEFIEPLNKPEPVQEEFVWPLCWEIQCGDA